MSASVPIRDDRGRDARKKIDNATSWDNNKKYRNIQRIPILPLMYWGLEVPAENKKDKQTLCKKCLLLAYPKKYFKNT